ncbi:hypoxia-inducible factor 1-alpha-like [Scyliorhinus canicula]|uniref:hypoxia-inducible factor 1-alpha-like n=1 Tax=Scyliorhinus canicula TaxID=7830 RepID=UPI0018F503F7|nr:hypoxia-inducible factor 1-alpha-like [Scyliorhinus canicula]
MDTDWISLYPPGTTRSARADLDSQFDGFLLRALDGFIMVLSEEGDIVYLSENVDRYLGLTQLDLVGHSVFEFVHPCDEEELKDLVTLQQGMPVKQDGHTERDFFMRMKSTLSSRGRTVAIKSATWKVLHCTGHMKRCEVSSKIPDCEFPESPMSFLVMICEPIPHPSTIEMALDTKTFLSRHSLDMKFTHCDQKITDLIGYHPKAMLGHTSYEFYHSLDFNHMTKTHRTLLSKGQVTSDHYRFLANNGGYVWLKTQATAIYNSKNSRPECIVCINFVLSAVLEDTVIFSLDQTRGIRELAADLGKSQDLLTQWNDNPEKLEELAPTPGDTIVPLELTARLGSKAFHFTKTLSEDGEVTLPPEEFCTPELCQLLSPIFGHSEGLRWKSSKGQDTEPLNQVLESERKKAKTPKATIPGLGNDESSDMKCDIKDFCFNMEVVQNLIALDSKAEETETDQVSTELDLEMLAPYISMEEDFQLINFESAEEKGGQACGNEHPDTDPNARDATRDDSSEEKADTAPFRPRSSSLHSVRPSTQSLRQDPEPQGGPVTLQRSSSAADLSETRALSPSNTSIAFGGPAFTLAVQNVLLALFQPQTTVSPSETGNPSSHIPSTSHQGAESLMDGVGLEPSDRLDSVGTESTTPGGTSRQSPSKQRELDMWAIGKDQEKVNPQMLALRNLKRKHSVQHGNRQDSIPDVSRVAEMVQVTVKRLKKIAKSKSSAEAKHPFPATPMTLTMQLLAKEISGPPSLTGYDCEVEAPNRHPLLHGAELLKALDQVS